MFFMLMSQPSLNLHLLTLNLYLTVSTMIIALHHCRTLRGEFYVGFLLDTPRPTNIESPPYTDEEPWPQWPSNTTNSEKKRDRFVFKHVHHDILNEAFLRNRYPENDEKECLVDKCNAALENYKNRPLKESEKMTILNITNWFNNRRKEKKRNRRTLDPSSYCVQNLKENNEVKEEIISEDDV
ncbi:homeobox-containing protein 1 [Tetranychus urticae]|uniref:Homeobox domain-containing protein n=1 Tax=Tetranychus urticae TaxID=32264 RepID=T1JQH0_TETUR|nr:homeobox-containing protein 1 [Tetranychus urticae]